jgi:hypothetical protein
MKNFTIQLPVQLLQAVAKALGVYYNHSGQAKCYNLSQDATNSLGDKGWGFQVGNMHTTLRAYIYKIL